MMNFSCSFRLMVNSEHLRCPIADLNDSKLNHISSSTEKRLLGEIAPQCGPRALSVGGCNAKTRALYLRDWRRHADLSLVIPLSGVPSTNNRAIVFLTTRSVPTLQL